MANGRERMLISSPPCWQAVENERATSGQRAQAASFDPQAALIITARRHTRLGQGEATCAALSNSTGKT
jgi:hypothetical protein